MPIYFVVTLSMFYLKVFEYAISTIHPSLRPSVRKPTRPPNPSISSSTPILQPWTSITYSQHLIYTITQQWRDIDAMKYSFLPNYLKLYIIPLFPVIDTRFFGSNIGYYDNANNNLFPILFWNWDKKIRMDCEMRHMVISTTT